VFNIKKKFMEDQMFEITDKASAMIRELLEGREEPISAIRIIMSEGG